MFVPKRYQWDTTMEPSFFECDECQATFNGSSFPNYNGILFRFCPNCGKPTGDYRYQRNAGKNDD